MSEEEEVEVVTRRQNSPLSALYIEVNDANFQNAGCYNLTTGEPLFDIAIIFASNINYDIPNRRAILYHNENVTRVLSDVDTYIRPLQEKGIKVLLSILGNHQGAGVCNFESVAGCRDFAQQLKDCVDLYGLDGIDFDDEYAGYGNNGTLLPNEFSFIILLRELRILMPDKIISFYFFGPASSRLQYGLLRAGDFLDYSWNAVYGTWRPPIVPNLDRSQVSPAAVWISSTSAATARAMATRTVEEGYGVYLYYSLPNNDVNNYLSGIAEAMYGRGTQLTANCLRSWPPGTEEASECACSSRCLDKQT